MDINDLKNNWNSINIPPDYRNGDTRELLSRVERGRVSTLRDRLSLISRNLALLCIGGILIMIPYIHDAPTLAVLATCFFAFMGVNHMRNYRRIRNLNFSQMSVREAVMAVGNIESAKVRLRALGMGLGLPLAVYMCFTITDVLGDYYVYSCVAGAAIGAVIGLVINHRSTTILREMRRQLSQEEE